MTGVTLIPRKSPLFIGISIFGNGLMFAARFANVYVYTVDEIGGNSCEMIGDGNSSLRSGNFVCIGDEMISPTSYMHTFECAGLMIRFACTFD